MQEILNDLGEFLCQLKLPVCKMRVKATHFMLGTYDPQYREKKAAAERLLREQEGAEQSQKPHGEGDDYESHMNECCDMEEADATDPDFVVHHDDNCSVGGDSNEPESFLSFVAESSVSEGLEGFGVDTALAPSCVFDDEAAVTRSSKRAHDSTPDGAPSDAVTDKCGKGESFLSEGVDKILDSIPAEPIDVAAEEPCVQPDSDNDEHPASAEPSDNGCAEPAAANFTRSEPARDQARTRHSSGSVTFSFDGATMVDAEEAAEAAEPSAQASTDARSSSHAQSSGGRSWVVVPSTGTSDDGDNEGSALSSYAAADVAAPAADETAARPAASAPDDAASESPVLSPDQSETVLVNSDEAAESAAKDSAASPVDARNVAPTNSVSSFEMVGSDVSAE